jgi:hypothetical protein
MEPLIVALLVLLIVGLIGLGALDIKVRGRCSAPPDNPHRPYALHEMS